MSKNKELGFDGEKIATDFLKSKGYKIIENNYRYRRAEIDIIAENEGILVFVEVKTRSNYNYGEPEHAVDEHKAVKIREAAENYIFSNDWKNNIRFDIISIKKNDYESTEITHFEDAII